MGVKKKFGIAYNIVSTYAKWGDWGYKQTDSISSKINLINYAEHGHPNEDMAMSNDEAQYDSSKAKWIYKICGIGKSKYEWENWETV